MDADARTRDGDEDAGESEHVRAGGGRKGQPSDQRHGKESRKGGKADRQKGGGASGDATGRGKQSKDAHVSWVQKNVKAETEHSEASLSAGVLPTRLPAELDRPMAGQNLFRFPDDGRRGKGQGKDKRQANWDGSRQDGKKDTWKERRGGKPDRFDAEGGASKGSAGGKQHGGGEINADANPAVLNGGALLSMLKANPPSVTRYTKEELLSIGQLPASKVRPSTLNTIIDKENAASPLLVKPKVDKAARGSRNREGEEEEYDEDAAGARRERRRARRGDSDEEEVGDNRRNRNKWNEERERGQRWKEEEQPQSNARGYGKGGHYDQVNSHIGYHDDTWAMPSTGGNDWAMPPKGGDQWSMPSKGGGGEGEWDMPDANDAGDLMDFTLGDIRKAEKSISKGMSISDYKASLRADQRERAAEPPQEVTNSAVGGKDRGKDRDGIFAGAGGVFFEEDEDVPQASRGFGKWFGRAPLDTERGQDEEENDDAWDMPAGGPPGRLDVPAGMGMPQGTASALQAAEQFRPCPASPSRPSTGDLQHPRSPEAHPLALSAIESLLEESPCQKREAASGAKPNEALPPSPSEASSNLLGKSILSMLGRTEPANGDSSVAESLASPEDLAKQSKLSVAELFHLAQGKELPPIPPVSSKAKEDDSIVEKSDQQKMQEEVLKMASSLMWMTAAKAGQPAMPPGSRYPGYQMTAPYGAAPPAHFGMARPGAPVSAAMMGRGPSQDHMYAEAYAAQAMMGVGRGSFPANSGAARGGHKGAQASWPGQMGAGYPFPRGPGYGSQSYGGYATPQDYSHLPRGAGDVQATSSAPSSYGPGAAEGTAKLSAPSSEKGNSRGGHFNQAAAHGAPLASTPGNSNATVATLSPDGIGGARVVGDRAGHDEAGEEDSGCSQS